MDIGGRKANNNPIISISSLRLYFHLNNISFEKMAYSRSLQMLFYSVRL